MKVILFDEADSWRHLLPLTYTRPIADLRIGIVSLAEKWKHYLQAEKLFYHTAEHLRKKFPSGKAHIWVNGAVAANESLAKKVLTLESNSALVHHGRLLAAHTTNEHFNPADISSLKTEHIEDVIIIDRLWKIFQHNAQLLKDDFGFITKGRESAPLDDPYTSVYSPENLFLEPGARVQAAIIDASGGPVYLGANSHVQPGATIRGSFSLGENSVINMGAKLRGDISIGPGCKVGGEVSNSVFQANSNKSHDGYLGNGVIGEWCNLGADTNSSNLKNTYAPVKVWNYVSNQLENSGQTFCGLMMGDHSKSGISTMFNTATVVGVGCNVYGSGFPPKFIPSFSWGGADGLTTFRLEKVIKTAELMLGRRNDHFQEMDRDILRAVFKLSQEYRNWEVEE